jgi:DNA-binding SARP family transcriptional activator
MSTLKVQLLGGFRIILDEQDISISFPERVRLLFAFILLNFDSPISRKQIAFTFWPDSTESQARTNLRNLLHHLRNSLPEADIFFEMDTLNIRLRSNAPIELDVQCFTKAISSAESCQDDQKCISHLQQAVDNYRGELLPDLYEDWLLKQREELQQSFVNALLRLGALLEDNRQYQEAIQVMNRLIRSDPLNELAYQRSMRMHALNNDRAGALKVYHACSNALKQELDVEPSQETQTYYKQILRLEDPATVDAKSKHPLDTKRMIGRQQEWGYLRKAWQATNQGESRAVLIVGEAGVGKTRLANEMAQWARRQGIYTAFTQCYPGEGELPYAPVVAWLRTPEFEKEIADLDSLWQDELARLLPEYKKLSLSDSAHNGIDQQWQRRRLFEAMAKGILGHRKPRLLILDDAQWGDQDTLDFIQYLLHYDKTAPLLLLFTARSEELTPANRANQMRILLRTRGSFQEIELKSLKKEEVRELVADLTGNNFQEEILDRLYIESEGNPLFVVEMLRSGKSPDSGFIPQSIRSLLAYRINQLSSSASDLVSIASAIGREFSYRLLEVSSKMDVDALVYSLDELWLRRVIQHHQGDNYNFTHGKLRDTAYDALSDARRRLCHQRIAEALVLISNGDAELENGLTAKHFELAGQNDQAIEYYIKAAQTSRRVFANSKAILYLEQALSLILENSKWDYERTRKTVEIGETLGDVYEITGKRENAVAIYSKALEQLSEQDNLIKARILGKIAKVSAARFGYENADEKFLQAVEALGHPPDESNIDWWRAWLDIQFERVWMYYNLANVERMESTLASLLPVIKRLKAQDKLIAYQIDLVALYFRRDRYQVDERTKQLAFEVLKKCQELNNTEYLIRATVGYGLASLWGGDLENAQQYLEEGLKFADQAGDVINQIISLTYLAVTNRLLSDAELCQSYATEALVLCEREGEPTYTASAKANLGWVAWRQGNIHQAKDLSLNAFEKWSEYYPFRWLALWTLIDINLQEGQLAQAVDYTRQIIATRQQALPEEGINKLTELVKFFERGNIIQTKNMLLRILNWAKEEHYL